MAVPAAPFVLFPLMALGLYRRFRGNFGRQPVRPRRMMLRAVALGVAAVALIALMALRVVAPEPGLGAVAGLALGALLGVVGLRYTRFETDALGRWYTPNPYLGFALSAVLLARLSYRYFVLQPGGMAAAGAAPPFGSPLTLALFGTLVGYYLCYTIGVLVRTRAAAASV